ncbi:MAG: PIN domain-containing protein [Chlorobium sp.]
MKNKICAVIDTNVVINAVLLPNTVSRQVFDFVVLGGELLASEESLAELNEVLGRPKFRKYVSEKRRLEFLQLPLAKDLWDNLADIPAGDPLFCFSSRPIILYLLTHLFTSSSTTPVLWLFLARLFRNQ